MKLLSIVMPVHNEGEYILVTLNRIKETVRTNFECIIVVDYLEDITIPFINQFSNEDPRFFHLLNDIGRGPALAIKKGINSSKGDAVAIVSGDGSDDVSQIDQLVHLIERGVGVAVASRHVQGGQLVGSPFLKGFLSKIAGLILYYFANMGTRDATNNFKIYSKPFLDSVVIKSQHGFEIGLELTTKAKLSNWRIAEIPTIWIERSEGKSNFPLLKSLPRYIYWFLKSLLRI
jgi:glycosyltransferase involved in cell wall biosynthesis